MAENAADPGATKPESNRASDSGSQRKGLVIVLLFVGLIFLAAWQRSAEDRGRSRAERLNCRYNLKQIGLAFKTAHSAQEDVFSFSISTNYGGTMEWSLRDGNGFDKNSWRHFQILSNELVDPRILTCPSDHSKQAAVNFKDLQESNVTYLIHSSTNLSEETYNAILVICPMHQHVLLCDGSVVEISEARKRQLLEGHDKP